MRIFLLILASLAPVAILLLFFEKQDKGPKEPLKLKWKVFKYGILMTIVAGAIELNLDWVFAQIIPSGILYIAVSAFITAALIEEAAKYYVVKKIVYNNKNFDEVMDGVYYTIIASLGFAALENILYVVEGGFDIAIIRALLSVPGHALFSGIMGYYIGKARFLPGKSSPRSLIAKGYIFAVVYHGLFNFLLMTESVLILLVIPLVVIMAYHLKSKIQQAQYEDRNTDQIPEKMTIWKGIRVFIGSLLLVIGAGSIAGAIMLTYDESSDYGSSDIISSIVFAIILAVISWLLMRSYQRKKESPKNG